MKPEDAEKISQHRAYFEEQLEALIRPKLDTFPMQQIVPAILASLCGSIASMCCGFTSDEASRLAFVGAIELLEEMFAVGTAAKTAEKG